MNGTQEKKMSADAPGVKVFTGTGRKKLTQARLKELLDYNPDTGIFTRTIGIKGGGRCGDVAGCANSLGYLRIMVDGKSYLSHRLAFLWMEGYFPENEVDHADRDTANNKWINLREVSTSCNLRNCNISKTNKSGVTGVCWLNGNKKWRAYINGNGRREYLGCFKTKLEAAQARLGAEVKYGFPNCNTNSSANIYLSQKRL